MKEINEDELQFVVRHYEDGALDTERAWEKLRQHVHTSAEEGGGGRSISMSHRRLSMATRRIAASVSIALIVSGSIACGLWYAARQTPTVDAPDAPQTTVTTPYRYLLPQGESVVLKYEDAPIDDVLSELSSYYGRTLVLQGSSDRSISGEIEATSLEEVVEILEATLDVEIVIQNKN